MQGTENTQVEITDDVIQVLSGNIEKLLLEKREGIAFAFRKIPGGLKISIAVELDETADGILTNYSVSYPMEPKPESQLKEKVVKKHLINLKQGDFFEGGYNA